MPLVRREEQQRAAEPAPEVARPAASPVERTTPAIAAPPAPAPPQPPLPARERGAPPAPPPPLGRGGPEHQYLQELVKRWGEAKGYRATVEEPLPSGGRVDVALRREGHALACEISVTTGADHEIGNVEKCLQAGFDEVVLLSLSRGTLGKVRDAVYAGLPEKDRARLHFMGPEEFFTFLDAPASEAKETTVGGYKVKVKYRPVEGEEAKRRSKAVSEILLKNVRKMRGTEGKA